MLRQIFKKVISVERNAVNVQRCWRVNYSSDSIEDEAQDVLDELEEPKKSIAREISFCTVHCIGRMGTPPKEVETKTGHTFVSFMLGCSNHREGKTKWHAVNINNPATIKNVLRNFRVGDRVYVQGQLSYTDGENYNKQYRIYGDKVFILQHSRKNLKEVPDHKVDELPEELDEDDVFENVK